MQICPICPRHHLGMRGTLLFGVQACSTSRHAAHLASFRHGIFRNVIHDEASYSACRSEGGNLTSSSDSQVSIALEHTLDPPEELTSLEQNAQQMRWVSSAGVQLRFG